MKFETLKRAEEVVDVLSLINLEEAIQEIIDQMEGDGFELKDVKEFIQVQLNEILGDQ